MKFKKTKKTKGKIRGGGDSILLAIGASSHFLRSGKGNLELGKAVDGLVLR